jgi:Spy/CpxP family protein refolding chaperone
MKPVFKTLLAAGVLAASAYAAIAQPMGMGGGHHPMMGGDCPMGQPGGPGMLGARDPAKVEAFMAKRAAELKAKLKITSTQEGAWTTFTSAMKPPARMTENRPDRAEMEKLTTPERMDKMKAMRALHMAEMNTAMEKRDEAVKALYAALTPEQQKVFDAEHSRLAASHDHAGHGRSAGMGRGAGTSSATPQPAK